jgi:hypothetical protein
MRHLDCGSDACGADHACRAGSCRPAGRGHSGRSRMVAATGIVCGVLPRWPGTVVCGDDSWRRVADHPLRPVLPVGRRSDGAVLHLSVAVSGGDAWHRFVGQHPALVDLLGADVAIVLPADRLLEAPARGAPGRAYGAGGHGCGRPCDDRGHADPRQHRGQLQPDGYPAVGGFDQILGLVFARADPDPAGRLHEVRAVPVPFLAAARDGRADAGLGLPAFGHDGEGGGVLDGAHVACAGGDRCVVLHRRHHGPCDDGSGRVDRAVQGRPEGAVGVFDGQPSGAS